MKHRRFYLAVLAVGLSLGTAWAVRGKFGHEQGAAWAGALGALSLILVAGRKDWYDKAFRILLAAAFGWGISGVMSYGVIVGYGRGTDFINVFYGLLMLFVVGGLYGILGGGIFGLALLDSVSNKVKWHSLLAEMVAFGLLTYGFLINQLGWLMTPPRSEMWAACLGAGIAILWYIQRNNHASAMRVALGSALGAGFGFSFGNFLQVLGTVSGLSFSFWNVMEYSIGFFGGLGMAYGTLTATWPVAEHKPSRAANVILILFATLVIPFVIWDQSFVTDRFDFVLKGGGSATTIFYLKLIAILAILFVAAIAIFWNYASYERDNNMTRAPGRLVRFFTIYMALYIFLSFLLTGIFAHPLEQYLYVINVFVILLLIPRSLGAFETFEYRPERWFLISAWVIFVIALMAVVAINTHGEMWGAQVRFGSKL